jgi:hypothetical protein
MVRRPRFLLLLERVQPAIKPPLVWKSAILATDLHSLLVFLLSVCQGRTLPLSASSIRRRGVAPFPMAASKNRLICWHKIENISHNSFRSLFFASPLSYRSPSMFIPRRFKNRSTNPCDFLQLQGDGLVSLCANMGIGQGFSPHTVITLPLIYL